MTTHPIDLDADRDLGFGTRVASEARQRLLNRDGSFNVARTGLGWREASSLYLFLLGIPWSAFLLLLAAAYLAANALFALAYLGCGAGAIGGGEELRVHPFLRAFFFSVETLSTIGFGQLTPVGVGANLLVTIESLVGLLALALATGLVFARFSRPTADVLFSDHAVVAPHRDGRAFMIRIANRRRNELLGLEARIVFSRQVEVAGRSVRRFWDLELERRTVSFFPLSWTIVHHIDEKSPLWHLRREDCLGDAGGEFLVLLSGVDDTFSQTVHARTSYRAEEVLWDTRFADPFDRPAGGPLTLDVRRIHATEPLLAAQLEKVDATAP